MESMKVSSAIKAYPNSFLLLQAVKRDESRRVVLANVLTVSVTKEEAFLQQMLFKMIGVESFVVPTFEETEGALSISISGDEYKSEPLLTPADNARLFRDYYGL